MEPLRIFISYSHENEIWMTETLPGNEPNPQYLLGRWKKEYPRENGYEFWYDREKDTGISGGEKWRERIFSELDRADVAILLISEEFIISNFIKNVELPRILNRASKGELEILPIYVEPAQLEKLEIPGVYQITPGKPTPLSFYYNNRHEWKTALIDVSRSMERVIERAKRKKDPKPEQPEQPKPPVIIDRVLSPPPPPPPPPQKPPPPPPPPPSVTHLLIKDATGTETKLTDYGVVYNPAASPVWDNALKHCLIIERGNASQEIPWSQIKSLVVHSPGDSVIVLREGKSLDHVKLRSGRLVGKDDLGFAFVLEFSKWQTITTQMPVDTAETPVNAEFKIITNEKDGTKMVLIPAGEFWAGSRRAEEGGRPFQVNLPAFYMAVHTVTNLQYAKFLNEADPGQKDLDEWIKMDSHCFVRMAGGGFETWGEKDDHPVVGVSWHGAIAYCKWAGLRLPTELEWEKGARGTDGREYPWGNEFGGSRCKWSGTPRKPGEETTCSVYSYPEGASPWGLFHMIGNVRQWCADEYDSAAYDRYRKGDFSIPQGDGRVVRGSPYSLGIGELLRCAYRSKATVYDRNSQLGFRCAMNP